MLHVGGPAWLVVAGVIWLLAGATVEGATYDAVVHAGFLGFTISILMGIGAVFGALNTMYNAVASRTREIFRHRLLRHHRHGHHDQPLDQPGSQADDPGGALVKIAVRAPAPEIETGSRGFWPLRDLPVVFWLLAWARFAGKDVTS